MVVSQKPSRYKSWPRWALPMLTVYTIQRGSSFQAFAGPKHRTPSPPTQLSRRAHQGGYEPPKTGETRKSNQVSRFDFLSIVVSTAIVSSSVESSEAYVSAGPSPPSPSKSSLAFPANDTKTLEESISGFVAGASLTITKTLVKYPLDTATVRLQMPGTIYSIRDLSRLFGGSFDGVAVPLITNIPAGGVFFAVKDATKVVLKTYDMPKWASICMAVAVAQMPYWLVRNPSEVVKTRQQAGLTGYGDGASAVEAFRRVWQESKGRSHNTTLGNIEGFYSGYWENILYAFPADVIKFVCYDTITQGKKNLAPLDGAVAGAISTAVAQCVTTPLDVIRNRIMAGERTVKGNDEEERRKKSYVDTLIELAREEGIEGLFAGVSPRIGKAVLSGAIQFATYEETKQTINRVLDGRKN